MVRLDPVPITATWPPRSYAGKVWLDLIEKGEFPGAIGYF